MSSWVPPESLLPTSALHPHRHLSASSSTPARLLSRHLSRHLSRLLHPQALRSRGVDEAPSAQLSARYAELWGTADEEAARRRLLSFVACEALEPHWRMGALGLADTCARLEHGLRGLQARQTTLATEVALRRAVGTTDDE